MSIDNWQKEYANKLTTADNAAKVIKPADTIYIHSNAAAPQSLVDAMIRRAPQLKELPLASS